MWTGYAPTGDGTWQVTDCATLFASEEQARVYTLTGQIISYEEAIRMAATTPTARWKEKIQRGSELGTSAVSAFRDSERFWTYMLAAMEGKSATELVADTGLTLEEVIELSTLWNDLRTFLEQPIVAGSSKSRLQGLGLVA